MAITKDDVGRDAGSTIAVATYLKTASDKQDII